MDRRHFFKTGAKAAAAGAAISLPITPIQAADSPAAKPAAGVSKTPAILASYTAEDHRRRLTTRRHLHAENPQVHAQTPDYRLSPRSMRLQPGRVSQPHAVGARRIRRTGIGSAEGPWHPIDSCDGRMERSLRTVRTQQVDGGQSGRISPFRGDGPPARHQDPGLRIERVLCRERSGLPQGMVATG